MADKSASLLDSDSEDSEQPDYGGDGSKLSINKKFAKEFELRKQRQELVNAKNDIADDNDDDASSEDEDGELLTSKLDTNIMKTLNALRSKDKAIYDPSTRFFENTDDEDKDDDNKASKASKAKEKPKKYKDLVREQILEDMNKENIDEDEDGDDKPVKAALDLSEGPKKLAYDDEQREIRKAFLQSAASGDNDDKDDDDGEDMMILKRKAKKASAEHDDKEFLAEVEKLEQSIQQRKGGSRSVIVDPKGEVENGEQFLLNFFKNRRWMDAADDKDDSSSSSSASHNEEQDEKVPMKTNQGDGDDYRGHESDDSLEQLEKNDDFEARYNFRFEEAATGSGADHSIVGYARGQVMNTLRRKDDTRSQKRKARKERKEAERRAKEEQLKRLKNAKRKEMESKLREIKNVLGEVGGNGEAAVDEAAILKLMEGDYDPEKFAKLMEETFGEDYYQKEDSKWKSDKDLRQELKGDPLLAEDGDDGEANFYDEEEEEEDGDGEHEDGNDDNEEGNGEHEEEEWVEEEYDEEYGYANAEQKDLQESQLERKLRQKVEDELYKLDYEDIVAGIPTRFKYRQVEPNNYGLSAHEILLARDSTLRQYVSLKKMAPYREDGEHVVGRKRRRQLREMIQRDLEEQQQQISTEESVAKMSALKSAKKAQVAASDDRNDTVKDVSAVPVDSGEQSKKKRKRRKSNKKSTNEKDIRNEGINETKKEDGSTEKSAKPDKDEANADSKEPDEEHPKSKRRRRKKIAKKDSHDSVEQEKALKPRDDNDRNDKETNVDKKPRPFSQGESKCRDLAVANEPPTPTDEVSRSTNDQECLKQKSSKEHKANQVDTTTTKKRSKSRKKSKKLKIEGMTNSRLTSYGL
ncbi:hypothetical protein ACA910_004923 [Epithemia clementina (nom. ined.)]